MKAFLSLINQARGKRLAPRFGAGRHRALFVVGAISIAVSMAVMTGTSQAQISDEADGFQDLAGLRFGISVTDLEGNVLVAHRADERFVPASNAKLFVTAAALASETELTALDPALRVVSERGETALPTLALIGRGDPTVGYGEECEARCIETLAEAVAASGITEVGDIVGDDRWFADERRPLGWNWDDLKFGHATSISAIAVNESIVSLKVSPSTKVGGGVRAAWVDEGPNFFDLENEARTSASDASMALRLERRIGENKARLYGELPSGSRAITLDLGVDDPAYLAAWYFRQALQAEGVSVSGKLRTRRRPLQYADEPVPTDQNDPDAQLRCTKQGKSTANDAVIAALDPAPIREIVFDVNRDSQNLYAEVLLRQLGRTAGTGSSFCGRLQIQKFLEGIGVPRTAFDIADGSGLSNYNRATPAAITALLSHAAKAPWGKAYKASLPVGGDPAGTLKYRFRGTALEGKIFAKTGSLNHVDALSGYMQARSGKTLVFSVIVNDRPLDSPSARNAIDSTLVSIAEQY